MADLDRRGMLESLRVRLSEALDGGAKPYEMAQLSRELRAVLKELAELPTAVEPTAVEANPQHDFARQRSKRLADPDVFDEAV